jgi:hypothetical protein
MTVDRREFLKGTILVAGSAYAFVREVRGHTFGSLLIEPQDSADPILFESVEILAIAAIAAQIIPTTEQPGAAEVGVVVHINSRVTEDSDLLTQYREGLAEVSRTSQDRFRQPFQELGFDDQNRLLQGIEESPFFARIRRHTLEAFYVSPVGIFVASGHRAGTTHAFCSANEGFPDVDKKPTI